MNSGDDVIRAYFEKFGEVEHYARVVKENFSTAYGFVVFKSHRASESYRVSGEATMFIDNQIVKIAPSKPTKAVNDTAQTAGLLDYERNPTQLLFTLLGSALDIYERSNPFVRPGMKEVFLQDPVSGMYYKWQTTDDEYAQYIEQKIKVEQQQIQRFQTETQHILYNIAQLQTNNHQVNAVKPGVTMIAQPPNGLPSTNILQTRKKSVQNVNNNVSVSRAPTSLNSTLHDPTLQNPYLKYGTRFSPY
jgi:hypothetical protein